MIIQIIGNAIDSIIGMNISVKNHLDNFHFILCNNKFSISQLISIIAAVAEMERENIRVQTMAGREQKAREGKWNGGFAPYGYKLRIWI